MKNAVASAPEVMKVDPLDSSRKVMVQVHETQTREFANGRIRAYADGVVNEVMPGTGGKGTVAEGRRGEWVA